MKTLKLLTGTTFALLLMGVCGLPTMAQTTITPGQSQEELENDDQADVMPGQENQNAPEFPQQNNPDPTNNQMQQNTRPGTTGQSGTMQRNTTTGQQDLNNTQQTTEQLDQQNQQNIRQRTVQEQIQRRTTTTGETQPSQFNTQPAAGTQTEMEPTMNVQEEQPVRALW